MAITFWIGCRRSIDNLDEFHSLCNEDAHSTLKDENTQQVIEYTGPFNCTGSAAESHVPFYWGEGELGEGLSLKAITLKYILTEEKKAFYTKRQQISSEDTVHCYFTPCCPQVIVPHSSHQVRPLSLN